jgi:anti-sigma B factor antagonist
MAEPAVLCSVRLGDDVVFEAFVVERSGGGAVLQLVGELDTYSAPSLRRAFEALEGRELSAGATALEVDAARLEFLDSSGLVVLVSAMQDLSQRGVALRVVNPTEIVRQTVRATGLEVLLGDPSGGAAT